MDFDGMKAFFLWTFVGFIMLCIALIAILVIGVYNMEVCNV